MWSTAQTGRAQWDRVQEEAGTEAGKGFGTDAGSGVVRGGRGRLRRGAEPRPVSSCFCEDVLILRQCCHTRIAPFKQRLKRNFSMHLLSLHVCLFIRTAQEHYLFYPFLIFPAHCWLTSDGVSLLWHAVCGEKGQRHFATKASKGCQGLGRC